MAALKAFIAVAAIAVLAGAAAAADNHTVGAPGGTWDLQYNSSWAQSQTFKKGDNLIFKYDVSQHDVVEVSKANYDSCSTANAISTRNSGNDVFALTAVGSRYFICGTPGHCKVGMKIEVDTVAASGPSPSPSTPGTTPSPPTGTAPPPSTPGTTPSPPNGTSPPPSTPGTTPPPPPPPSGASKTTVGFGLGLGMLMVLAL